MDSILKIFLENLKTKSYNYTIVSLIRFALFILDEQNYLNDIDLGVNELM